VVVVGLAAAVPSYYARRGGPPDRPVLHAYRTLAPFQATIQAPGTVLVASRYGFELCAYLSGGAREAVYAVIKGRNVGTNVCQPLDYDALRGETSTPTEWWGLLGRRGATMFYANEAVTADPVMHAALAEAEAAGWEILMHESTERGEQLLLRRRAARPALEIRPAPTARAAR
jgi:hypothetical protein